MKTLVKIYYPINTRNSKICDDFIQTTKNQFKAHGEKNFIFVEIPSDDYDVMAEAIPQ